MLQIQGQWHEKSWTFFQMRPIRVHLGARLYCSLTSQTNKIFEILAILASKNIQCTDNEKETSQNNLYINYVHNICTGTSYQCITYKQSWARDNFLASRQRQRDNII